MFDVLPDPEEDLSALFNKNTIRRSKPEDKPASVAVQLPEKSVATPRLQKESQARSEINLGLKSIYARRPSLLEGRHDTGLSSPFLASVNAEKQTYLAQIFARNTLQRRSDGAGPPQPLLPLDSVKAGLSTQRHHKKLAEEGWLSSKSENPQDMSFNELYYKYRKLQLHYSVCQILLKVGLSLNAQLQEICSLIVEKFSLWQCHIFLLEADQAESLSCVASVSKKHMEFLQYSPNWAVKVGSQTQLGQVLTERRDVLTGHELYNRYSLPICHQQEIRGVIDIYYAPSHLLTVEEQVTLKTIAAQLSSYLEEYHKHERAQQMAITDGLTHLYNHRYFQQRFEEAIRLAHHNNQWLSLILLDIDFFKQINDVHGHLQGDKVLQRVAAIIRRSLRTEDIAARYGGEEFAILLPNTSLELAEQVASRLRESIEAEEIKGNFESPLRITASLGVAGALAPQVGQREAIIAAADEMLYAAKAKGRNQVQVSHALLAHSGQQPSTSAVRSDSSLRWRDFFRRQEEAIKEAWLTQTKNYAVPEVTNAVWRMKPALSEILSALGDLLDLRLSVEEFKQRELLPGRLVREIQEGSAELSLISFEMAVILLQESFKQVVAQSALPVEDNARVSLAIDQLADRLNAALMQLFRQNPTEA